MEIKKKMNEIEINVCEPGFYKLFYKKIKVPVVPINALQCQRSNHPLNKCKKLTSNLGNPYCLAILR